MNSPSCPQDGEDLMLDGKQIVDAAKGNSGFLQGEKGWHSIELDCQRDNNPDVSLDLHLLWKKPGGGSFPSHPHGRLWPDPG